MNRAEGRKTGIKGELPRVRSLFTGRGVRLVYCDSRNRTEKT